jgi:hypothetical protein
MALTPARDLIDKAHEYPPNHPARLAFLAESAAVSLAFLAEHATRCGQVPPLPTPGALTVPSEPEPEAASSVESLVETLAPPSTPKRARRPRASTSPAPTDINAS